MKRILAILMMSFSFFQGKCVYTTCECSCHDSGASYCNNCYSNHLNDECICPCHNDGSSSCNECEDYHKEVEEKGKEEVFKNEQSMRQHKQTSYRPLKKNQPQPHQQPQSQTSARLSRQ